MRKLTLLFFLLLLTTSLVACSSETSSPDKENKPKEDKPLNEGKLLSKEEFEKMYSEPKKYKGSKVEFYARIFVEPEKDEDGTYLHAYVNDNSDRNILIGIAEPNLEVKVDDIIFVSGIVEKQYEVGGKVIAPIIKAQKVELQDYATAFSPTLNTIEVNQEKNLHGFF